MAKTALTGHQELKDHLESREGKDEEGRPVNPDVRAEREFLEMMQLIVIAHNALLFLSVG